MAQFLTETGSGVTAEFGSIHYTAHKVYLLEAKWANKCLFASGSALNRMTSGI